MAVVLRLGNHSFNPPKEVVGIVERKLEAAGYGDELKKYEWLLHPMKRVRGTPHTPRFKAIAQNRDRKTVAIRVQPDGGNDTAWAYHLTIPNGMRVCDVFKELSKLTENRGRRSPLQEKNGVVGEVEETGASMEPSDVSVKEKDSWSPPVPVTSRQSLVRDEEAMKLILLALSLEHEKGVSSILIDRVRELIRCEIGKDATNHTISGILRALSTRGLITTTRQHGFIISVQVVGGLAPEVSVRPTLATSSISEIDQAVSRIQEKIRRLEEREELLRVEALEISESLAGLRVQHQKLIDAQEIVATLMS